MFITTIRIWIFIRTSDIIILTSNVNPLTTLPYDFIVLFKFELDKQEDNSLYTSLIMVVHLQYEWTLFLEVIIKNDNIIIKVYESRY